MIPSLNAPPYFNGKGYSEWKVMMFTFLSSQDDGRQWEAVDSRYHVPMTEATPTEPSVPIVRARWSEGDRLKARSNMRALNNLFMAVSDEVRRRIINCSTAFDAWQILATAYEGTSTAKEEKIQALIHQFDELKMSENESIDEFYSRMLDIANQCHGLEHPISQSRMVRQLVWGLPPSFESKQNSIEDAKNLNTYTLDELVGNLKNYEMRKKSKQKERSLAFSSVKEEVEKESVSEDSTVEEFAYLTKQFEKFLKNKKKFGSNSKNEPPTSPRYPRHGETSNTRNPKPSFKNRDRDRPPPPPKGDKCFECGGVGHRAAECANRLKKKAFKATWSDSESEHSSEHEEDKDTVAFIASVSYANNSDSDNDDAGQPDAELNSKHSELLAASQSMVDKMEHLSSQITKQENQIQELENKLLSRKKKWKDAKAALLKEKESLLESLRMKDVEISHLSSERATLKIQLEDWKKEYKKFSVNSDKLKNIIDVCKPAHDMGGLGFGKGETSKSGEAAGEKKKKKRSSKKKKEQPKPTKAVEKFVPKCHHCGVEGHIRPHCYQLIRQSFDAPGNGKDELLSSLKDSIDSSLKELVRIVQTLAIPKTEKSEGKKVWIPKEKPLPDPVISDAVEEPDSDSDDDDVARVCFLSRMVIKPKPKLKVKAFCNIALTALSARKSDAWYVDSGCSAHMTGDPKWFVSRDNDYPVGSVKFGDGAKCAIIGKGTVRAPGIPELKNVLLVEGLEVSLLSVSQIVDENDCVMFDRIKCLVLDGRGRSVMKGQRTKDECYCVMAQEKYKPQLCFRTQVGEPSLELWHRRLCHLNHQDIVKLSTKEGARGLPKLSGKPSGICGECKIGKLTRSPHSALNAQSTSHVLELLHMDLVGPVETRSINGAKYTLVIVDDFSRVTWVYFIASKSDTFDTYFTFAKKVSNEKKHEGKHIVRIRTDHGTEFDNAKFDEYCDQHGVHHEYSSPITPQQNGIVERKNRVLVEMTRVMLGASGLPHSFWAEAVSNACYTLNRAIFRPGTDKTPYEIWKGRKPNLAHLKVFGSPCYIYKDREYLTKLDARSDVGVFLGYSLTSRAYRVYNKVSCKVMETVNVAINDGLDCAHKTGCAADEDVTPSTDPQKPEDAPAEVKEEESSADEAEAEEVIDVDEEDRGDASGDSDPAEGRRDETLAIQTPHRTGKRQVQKDHSTSDIIGDLSQRTVTRSKAKPLVNNYVVLKCFLAKHKYTINEITHYGFVSTIEPKNVKEALCHADWIGAMQEELNQFERSKVWHLVPRPKDKNVIGTKWVFKNKSDEKGVITRNKARLVVQGYSQIEGLDFDETFAPVARLESVRLLLAIACYMKFTLYQMDVKSAFLNGILAEEVYVAQPPGFVSTSHHDHVYRLDKALYGLKQAPRAWYERLSTYLLEHGYSRGSVDKTMFIKITSQDMFIAQIYVDDIVFGSTSEHLVQEFSEIMSKEFEMSHYGKLTYFLGLQVEQRDDGMFISQSKYAKELVKKFGMETSTSATNPMGTSCKISADLDGVAADQSQYRSMIGSLLYLTASRPDICYSVGVCARYQANPKESHVKAVKRIIKYISGTSDYGINYTFDTNCEIAGYLRWRLLCGEQLSLLA